MIASRLDVVRRSARLERARAAAPRALFVCALALTSLVGLRELVIPASDASRPAAGARPDYALADYAEGFARAYLSYDAARPELRERALARYVGDELGLDAGFTPPARGVRRVEWTRVAQDQEALAGGRIVVVAAGIAGELEPVYLAVPVRRDDGGAVALAGHPALIGPPARALPELARREEVEDPEARAVCERVVRNYLAGERRNLAADLAPGASVSPPAERLRVRAVEEIAWADGPESGAALVTVSAADERGGAWTLAYELGLERRGGRVVVSFVETLANES